MASMKQGAADDPFADEPEAEPEPPDEPAPEADEATPAGRMEAILAALEGQDAGDVGKTAQAWDQDLAAVLHALEEREELDDFGRSLSKRLDREPLEGYTRSDVVRLAVRWALEQLDETLIEDLRDAKAERARRET